MTTRAVLLVGLLAACEKKAVDRPGDCLPLPAAARSDLVADPQGGGLYWLEPVQRANYDAQLATYWKLVRFDLHSRRLESLYDHVESPVYIFEDKMLMIRTDNQRRLVLQTRGGRGQELLPDYLSPVDAEWIDAHTIAVLADGDGPRAVYTVDLQRPRPHLLHDADAVLSSKDGIVYTWVDDKGVAIDVAKGTTTTFEQKEKATPLGDEIFYVDGEEVVGFSMAKGTTRPVIEERRAWKLVHQHGAVLARTPMINGRSYATLIEPGRTTPLATLVGGTSILGVARLRSQTWALVGHDTANYDGDLAATSAETEVCLLPESGDVTFKTRSVPGRYAHKENAIQAAMARLAPNAVYQILDGADAATTLFVELPNAGNDDHDAMRDQVTRIHEQVTALLEDPEVITELRYADLRSAVYRWRRARLRGRASSGMGDVTLGDASSYDLEVADLVNGLDDEGKMYCSAKLTNLTKEPLTDLEVRCILGNRTDVIRIPVLPPGKTFELSERLEADVGAEPLFEVVRKQEPLELYDRKALQKQKDLLELALRVYRETELALSAHSVADDFSVSLLARRGFDRRSESERAAAVDKAYRAYNERMREIFDIEASKTLEMTLDVDHSEVGYTYDGEVLSTK